MTEKNFPKGIYFNQPHEKAPDFVKGSVSIKKADFIEWLQQQPVNNNGYINNLDLKVSQAGKSYMEENTWKPNKEKSTDEYPEDDKSFSVDVSKQDPDSNIPF